MQLARLIDEPERQVKKALAKLEHLSGYRSEDIRLLAETKRQLAQKIEQLGLDPHDTTGEELYEAMQAKLKNDLAHVARALNLEEAGSEKTLQVLESVAQRDELLAIKSSTMKSILKLLPPKKTVKLLGYRSVDSMLKREDAGIVLAVALTIESSQWNSRLGTNIGRLRTIDYELRPVKFLELKTKTETNLDNVTAVPLMATVCLKPQRDTAHQAAVVLLALEAGSFLLASDKKLKSKQFSKDFNKQAEQIFSGYQPVSEIDQQLLGLAHQSHGVNHAYKIFSSLHPSLFWWQQVGHIAMDVDGPVSLHLSDNVMNFLHGRKYTERFTHNFVASLKNELAGRYLQYQSVKNYVGAEIDDTFISLENISAKQLVPDFEEIRNL